MIPFFSKHNQVYPVLWNGRSAVEKHFRTPEDWAREKELYRCLSVPHPELLEERPNVLVTALCPHPTLLAVLEQQEESGFEAAPWEALACWLNDCFCETGQLPAEGNLRNFLWDVDRACVLGLDFECFGAISLQQSGAAAIAALLEYHPADTAVKRQAAACLTERLQVPEASVERARETLRESRKEKTLRPFSGIVLAGGHSRRMGCSKAELMLNGKTLLQHQVEKLRTLGIEDILLSGANCPQLAGTRVIPDELPDRGPLGGLHACLLAAEHPAALVLSVDAPLVPETALAQLCRAHENGVTVLSHRGKQEPLIGVYDSRLAGSISPLIQERGVSVRALKTVAAWKTWEYLGPEEYLMNCNTPEEYAQMQRLCGQDG